MKFQFTALDDLALNPVMVKELRQVTRSRFLIGIVMFYLIGMVGAIGIFLLGSSLEREMDMLAGLTLFNILLPILNGTCLFFIPAYVGIRLAAEHSDTNTDLLFTTTLTPGAIVRGKLFSGVIITVLFYSICVPFMILTYLLRGIDIPTMFVTLVPMFLITVLVIQIALFVAALPATKPFKGLLALAMLGAIVSIVVTTSVLAAEFHSTGLGGRLGTWDFWGPALTFLVAGSMLFVLLHSFTVALIMPASANRSLPVRVACTVAWLVTGVMCAITANYTKSAGPLAVWASITVGGYGLLLLAAVSEFDSLRLRVRRALPRRKALRPLAFLFYSGAAGGIFLCCLIVLITFVIATFFTRHAISWRGGGLFSEISTTLNTLDGLQALFLYFLAYALIAVFLRRHVFREKIPHKYTVLMAMLLIALGALVPSIIGWHIRMEESTNSLGLWQLGNVGAVFFDDYRDLHMLVSSLAALTMVIVSSGWLYRQMREFMVAENNSNAEETRQQTATKTT